jgi:uncharacterized protein (DUF2384 family)
MCATAAAIDLRHPDAVAHELGEANRRLARAPQAPAAVLALVADVADAIRSSDEQELAGVNPWTWIRVQNAALLAQGALSIDDPGEQRRTLRLALEQLRFLFARLADRQPVADDRPATEIARWLDDALPSVSQQRKAGLLRVSPRTYQRWISRDEPTVPRSEDEIRLRRVARIVNQLRFSLTAPGVVDWFERPRADLGGDRPADVADDPARLEDLVIAAAASRTSTAA